jgi:hypothetical protein
VDEEAFDLVTVEDTRNGITPGGRFASRDEELIPDQAPVATENATTVETPTMANLYRMTASSRPSPRAPPIAAGHRPIPPFGGTPSTVYLSGNRRSITDFSIQEHIKRLTEISTNGQ